MVYPYAKAITTSDVTGFEKGIADAIYIGGAGIAQVVMPDDAVVPFTCVAGEILPVRCKRVNSTSTTATLMVALYR